MNILSKLGVEQKEGVLNNGSRVFLFRRKGMPIHLTAIIKAGSRFDVIHGTAHFVEHMLLAGTKKFPQKNLIAEYLQNVGGDFGAYTNFDLISFNIEIPESSDLNAATEVFNECLCHSLFDPKTIENERGSIFSELKSRKSSPQSYIGKIITELLLQGTGLNYDVLGTEEDIKNITKQELESFWKKNIHAGNVDFIVSGDVDFDDLVESLNKIELQKGVAFISGGPLPISLEKRKIIQKYPGVKQLQVRLSTRIPVDSLKELCEVSLLNKILGQGRGSRLITKLRYENGLVYSISGGMHYIKDWGSWGFAFSCDSSNLEKSQELIWEEFDKVKNEGVGEQELEIHKNKIRKGVVRDLQTSASWVDMYDIDAAYFNLEERNLEVSLSIVENITNDDLKRVANKYLVKENFYTAICGDLD